MDKSMAGRSLFLTIPATRPLPTFPCLLLKFLPFNLWNHAIKPKGCLNRTDNNIINEDLLKLIDTPADTSTNLSVKMKVKSMRTTALYMLVKP